jgi:hypothetical protein
MRYIDVFNGDADGICALHQLRLAEPADGELVTGLKRDVGLLARVRAGAGSLVTVLDLSLDRNRADLLRLLSGGASVWYFDHHVADPVPEHPRLQAWIDASPETCTGILVDRYLTGRYRPWAIVAAFGDGLAGTARRLAGAAGFDEDRQSTLCGLGEALNYNAYGETEADVLIAPRSLYRIVHRYADPFELWAREPVVPALVARLLGDLAAARRIDPLLAEPRCRVHRLPDADWSRRVIGAFANRLADENAGCTCVVFKDNPDATLRVSLRAPRGSVPGVGLDADGLCRRFGGFGRAGAAGVDGLPLAQMEEFMGTVRAAAAREP